MTTEKLEALRAAGWTVGTVQELLGLSDEEMAGINALVEESKDIRIALEDTNSDD